MNRNYTHITMVLDQSGSMATVATDTIGLVNKFVGDQAAMPGQCTFTLVQFDHALISIHDFIDIKSFKPLTIETYAPRGSTALYDAIGCTAVKTGELLSALDEPSRPSKVIFVIMTDGLENASRRYTHDMVSAMIRHQQDVYSWEFVYLGADHDAIAVGSSINIPTKNNMNFIKTGGGIRVACNALSSGTAKYRAGGLKGEYFEESSG